MAPEQLEGQEADARTDIFAFGAVLYEMATGRRAFQGKNKTSLIAAIVSSTPPPVSQVAPLTPPALDHLIRKCLAKDPDDRWQSMRDVADQLRWIAEAGSKAGEPRLTFHAEDEFSPIWSPDDRFVYFCSRRQGKGDVFRKSSAGTGTDEPVLADPNWSILASVPGEGGRATVQTQNQVARTGWDISFLDLASGKTTPFLQTPFQEQGPRLSRDSGWLLYQSDESGRSEIYVQRLDGDGGKWAISTDGGNRARWARSDREIVFLSPDAKLMAVDVRLDPEFSASPPQVVMDPGVRQILGMQYDIAGDGSRLLVNRAVDEAAVTPVTLVQNWTEALGE
jgi:hypothetical protein